MSKRLVPAAAAGCKAKRTDSLSCLIGQLFGGLAEEGSALLASLADRKLTPNDRDDNGDGESPRADSALCQNLAVKAMNTCRPNMS